MEIFSREIPWEDVTAMQVVLMVGFHKSKLPIPTDAPKWAQDLMEQCFKDAEERPSFSQIIKVLRQVKSSMITEGQRVPDDPRQ